MHRKVALAVLALAAVVFVAVPSLLADNVYANIRGTVTDSTGAVVPGAQVTATNTGTGITKTTTSGSNGQYEFVQLPIGTYTVSASKQGFSSFKTDALTLVVNQVYSLPITLQVGNESQVVEVKADQIQVETSSTQLQNLVSGKQIVDLPLLGRNWTQLEQLSPGVVSTSDRFGTFAANGSQSNQSSYLINGTDSNDLPLNTPLIVPSPDAIQEFNLITNTINPEYGRNSGAIVNAVIKNGTNSLHGDVFDFYRDTFLNTHNFFQTKTPVFHQHQFGGTVGGPIIKDHTFFFLSYQGVRARQPQTLASLPVVLSPAERSGDFSELIATSGSKAGQCPLSGNLPSGQSYCSQFFSGGKLIIPTSRWNSISSNLIGKFVPAANFTGNQFSFNPLTQNRQDQGIGRFDHTFDQNNSIWGVMFFQHAPSQDTLPFTGANLPGFGQHAEREQKQFTVSYSHTFNPNTLNELRVGYTRFNFAAVLPQQATLPSSVGFNINPQNTAGAGLPTVTVQGFFTLGFSTNGPQPRKDQTYQITDNFSKVVGRHSLKFGYDGRRFQVDNPFYAVNNGSFTFAGTGSFTSGNPLVDFVLGVPDTYSQGSGAVINARTYEHYFYAQDSWRFNDKLTLNYGTGWQLDTPLNNNQFGGLAVNCFRPGQQSKVFPTAPVGLLFPGDSTCNKAGGVTTKYDHFGPRFGFAYAMNTKTSVRGGYGVYFNRFEEETALQNLEAPPFGLSSNGAGDFGGSPSFANPYVDIQTGQSEPNKFPFVFPTAGQKIDFTLFEPLSLNVIDRNFTIPYAQNFNLNVQRELPSNMVMTLGYVGSLARHLIREIEGNPITPAGAAACLASSTCVSKRSIQQVRFPNHVQFGNGDIISSAGTQVTDGRSSYHSLQASLNKGFSHGLAFLASYTWSHAIDDGSGFENSGFGGNRPGINQLVPGLNIGDSAYDARHRFVFSYNYELPNLHHLMSAMPDVVFGGWKITGITTLQTGFPVSIRDSSFRSLTCSSLNFYACPDTPIQVAAIKALDPRTSTFGTGSAKKNNYWFDPSDFVRQPIGSFGNVRRNLFHGPGINNTDLAIEKDIYLESEHHRYFELRLEGYNVFNHTQFIDPNNGNPVNGNINSANFGRITTAASGRLVQLGAKFYF